MISKADAIVPEARAETCRFCASPDLADLGELPDKRQFAGNIGPTPLHGGHLLRCRACGSSQRTPLLPDRRYLDLYRYGTDDIWVPDDRRLDERAIKTWIEQRKAIRSVLDVGCGTGGFLAAIAVTERFGIEPSTSAAAHATNNGVTILADEIAALDEAHRFDCITIIDVVEHIPDVPAFLSLVARHLNEGGCLIVSTGDPGAWPWARVFRNTFWYSSFPEHISFPSVTYMRNFARAQGLALTSSRQFRNYRNSAAKYLVKLVLQLTFALSGRLHRGALRLAFGGREVDRVFLPCGGVFRDHRLYIFEK